MKYTQAIRKIYESKAVAGADVMVVRNEASKAGYQLFLFNGEIYFITKHAVPKYEKTGLTIYDIEG